MGSSWDPSKARLEEHRKSPVPALDTTVCSSDAKPARGPFSSDVILWVPVLGWNESRLLNIQGLYKLQWQLQIGRGGGLFTLEICQMLPMRGLSIPPPQHPLPPKTPNFKYCIPGGGKQPVRTDCLK